MPRTRSTRRPTPVALLLLVLALPACGGPDPAAPEAPGADAAGDAFPVTVTGDDGELTRTG